MPQRAGVLELRSAMLDRVQPSPRAAAAPGGEPSEGAPPLFPPVDRAWTLAEYRWARDVLVELAQAQPARLPRADGPWADVLAKLADLETVRRAAAAAKSAEERLALSDTLTAIYNLYHARVMGGAGHGKESAAITAAFLHFTALMADVMEERGGVAVLRHDRAGLGGVLGLRFGYALSVAVVVGLPLVEPPLASASDVVRSLAPIGREVGRMLLPEEAAVLRDEVARLGAAGGEALLVAELLAALAEDVERHPLVAALVDEHRAFSNERGTAAARAYQATLSPLALGPEPGGTRYAFPDRSFSAVLDAAPAAARSVAKAEDGEEVTTRMLAMKDAVGLVRSIKYVSRSTPTPAAQRGDLTAMLKGMGLPLATSTQVSGHEAVEGRFEDAQRHVIVRLVRTDHGVCSIAAEYPARLAATAGPRARAFVDSVELASSKEA